MTAPHIVDPAGVVGEALSEASPDLMRSLLQSIINALPFADADAVVGAERSRATPGRIAQRNGYRHRDLDTRVGTIDVAVPKLRKGTYFPEWLLERRKRAETALITVVADCYLAGVSTRRMDKLVKTLGIDSLSKSQVSRMAAELDQLVEEFRHRPLDAAGPFTFLAADALTMKVRQGGCVVNAPVLLATGVNGDGHREVLGSRVTYGWPAGREVSNGRCDIPTDHAYTTVTEKNEQRGVANQAGMVVFRQRCGAGMVAGAGQTPMPAHRAARCRGRWQGSSAPETRAGRRWSRSRTWTTPSRSRPEPGQ